MAYYFPEYSVSILGTILVIIGFFKIRLYNWFVWLLWIGIVCEIITDIGRAGYMALMYYKANKKVTFRDPVEETEPIETLDEEPVNKESDKESGDKPNGEEPMDNLNENPDLE